MWQLQGCRHNLSTSPCCAIRHASPTRQSYNTIVGFSFSILSNTLTTPRREEYVSALEARLAKVETRLDKQPIQSSASTPLSVANPAPTVPKHTSSVSPAASSEPSVYDVGPSPVGGLYEGGSSFLNQSVQASEEIQRSAAVGTPEAAQTINESFSQLNSILHGQDDKKFSAGVLTRSMPEIIPLPASVVLAILRKIKGWHAVQTFDA